MFAWLRVRMLTTPVFSRDDLAAAEILGSRVRLVGTQTGIWKPPLLSAALSILTAYVPDESQRPYRRLRRGRPASLQWRGQNPNLADNRWLRDAMHRGEPLIWFVGIGYRPGTKTQVFQLASDGFGPCGGTDVCS